MKTVCEYCGKTFDCHITNYKTNKHHFCSRKCFGLSRRKRAEVVCNNCGVIFEKATYWIERSENHFCCNQCRMEFGRIEVECLNCGKKFSKIKSQHLMHENSFCNKKCYGEFVRHDKTDKRGRVVEQEWREKILEKDNFECKKCGSREHLQAHHVYSWLNYPKKRLEINNGVTLCRSCHLELHRHNGFSYIPVEN